MPNKIGLGFMRYDLKNPDNQNIIDFAMNNGVNYFETCFFYLDHQCENFVYALLNKYNRASYEICGKMSMSEAFVTFKNYQDLYYEQLRRVPGGYFDVYLLQTLEPHTFFPIFNTDLIEFLLKEKEKGNIVKFGFSEQCHADYLKQFLALNCWDIAQMPLNYYDWFLCEKNKNYELISKKNIPIIAQAPFKGGLLVNDRYNIKTNVEKVYHKPADQIAYDFVASKNPEIILTGCSQLNTIKNCLNLSKNSSNSINENDLKTILNQYKKDALIPCILCGKCEFNCPQNIDIATHFFQFNEALLHPENFKFYATTKWLTGEPSNACIRCNACLNACPNHINIPQQLYNLFELRA